MQIIFKNTKVEKQFSSKHRMNWSYPKQVQIKLLATENYILQADSLRDVANFPPFHLEKLRGNHKDEWSIRLGNTGYRVIFYPCGEDGKAMIGGDVLARCRGIRIVMIMEVSNHYE